MIQLLKLIKKKDNDQLTSYSLNNYDEDANTNNIISYLSKLNLYFKFQKKIYILLYIYINGSETTKFT